MELPRIPSALEDFVPYISKSSRDDIPTSMEPYRQYESTLREMFAQDRSNPVLNDPHVNVVPLFGKHDTKLTVRARNFDNELAEVQDKYILPLPEVGNASAVVPRKAEGALATVRSLAAFRSNFNVFSESALTDLDWSNVVVAGSAAVTPLLPVPDPHGSSKRALREYYHEKLAPASDVDLFLYGLDEAGAKQKIEQIERSVRDSVLAETTTIRTKYAVTIASQYPTRHIQIVLRLYKSVSEILTSFDVDSSCVAYDGAQVYATPRALAALVTQTNRIDLSRRSPSYENRLGKYSRRGFEVWCPGLDRTRVDPTIYERSFARVRGLARLLVLEKLPAPTDRDEYLAKRREERGRPPLSWQARAHGLHGNVKEKQPEDVAEWVDEEEVSSYHTFTVPYGPKFYAKKIEKLLFTKDLLLNAEWNKPKDRTVQLHRHPAFFGTASDIFKDCCGFCPEPQDEEEELVAETEAEIYIQGDISFVTDNPGRQQIGSFNPLTDDDWTEMAYVGNTARLCQAIVDGDVEHVQDWCAGEGADVNRRDHTGRTPLQLAAWCSTPEVAQVLINHGARLVARMADGMTALHIAARRGEAGIVKAILKKSEQNEEVEEEKLDKKLDEMRAKRMASKEGAAKDGKGNDEIEDSSDMDLVEHEDLDSEDSDSDEMTQGSFVRVEDRTPGNEPDDDGNADEPDVYDPNVSAWDYPVNPLHLAIMGGHVEVVGTLVSDFGADVLLPIKIKNEYSLEPRAAILTLVLATMFAPDAPKMARQLLASGASSSQADMHEVTALHFVVNECSDQVLDMLFEYDAAAATAAVNHMTAKGYYFRAEVTTPLLTALNKRDEKLAIRLLERGAKPEITLEAFQKAYQRKFERSDYDFDQIAQAYTEGVTQPIVLAAQADMPSVIEKLIAIGANVNTLTKEALNALPGAQTSNRYGRNGENVKSLLDLVRDRQEALRKALRTEKKDVPEVETLREDSHYLKNLDHGTYREWLASGDLERAKAVVKALHKQRDDEIAKQGQDEGPGSKEKRDAVWQTLSALEGLETTLVNLGAKTFTELHPDVKVEVQERNNYGYHHSNRNRKKYEEPYQTVCDYGLAVLGPTKENGYTALFEAAWRGDTRRVKELTMAPWRIETVGVTLGTDGSGEAPPLLVAMYDAAGFSPFAIAVLREHLQLARDILEIATVQHKPKKDEARYRYLLEKPEDDEDSDQESNNPDDVPISSRLVDAQYTINDIAALADTAESHVSPLNMLKWSSQVYRMLGSLEDYRKSSQSAVKPNFELSQWDSGYKEKYAQGHVANVMARHNNGDENTLWEYAIRRGDIRLFRFLQECGENLVQREESDESDGAKIFEAPGGTFDAAMRYSRSEMAGELIKRDGNRLPLLKFVERAGAEMKEKPKYYQGLTVYGRKRKDWADRSRGIMSRQPLEEDTPPLLLAAFENRVDVTEYFLSEAPLRRYEEFVETHRDHKAIQALSEKPGGIKKVLTSWLGARRELAIHASVLGRIVDKQHPTRQLEFLLDVFPGAVDHTNCDRITPLLAAFRAARIDAATLLIARGADQAARDRRLENVLHHLVYSPCGSAERSLAANLRALIGLLEPTLPKDLLVQRSSADAGGHTPLSKLLHLDRSSPPSLDALRVLLDFSHGRDLHVMSGAGDLPLHTVVRRGWADVARLFLERDPSLLHREHAVGATPMDVLDNAILRHAVKNPPSLPSDNAWGRPSVQNLVDRPAAQFDPGREQRRTANTLENTRRVCLDVAAASPHGKRKLVSLFDANEVAARLAEKERGGGGARGWSRRSGMAKYDDNSDGASDWKDEVEGWMRQAGCFFDNDRQWYGNSTPAYR